MGSLRVVTRCTALDVAALPDRVLSNRLGANFLTRVLRKLRSIANSCEAGLQTAAARGQLGIVSPRGIPPAAASVGGYVRLQPRVRVLPPHHRRLHRQRAYRSLSTGVSFSRRRLASATRGWNSGSAFFQSAMNARWLLTALAVSPLAS